MSPLLELAARVEAATGADRELDAEVTWALMPESDRKIFGGVRHIPAGIWMAGEGELFRPLSDSGDHIERFTSAPAVALRLIEQSGKWFVLSIADERSPVRFKGDKHVDWKRMCACLQWIDGGGRLTTGVGNGGKWSDRMARSLTAAYLRTLAQWDESGNPREFEP